jgi:hypothetical protein
MANLKLKTPGGGSVSLVSADTASDLTVTVPAISGTLKLDGPSFYAYASTNQTGVSSATWTKVNLGGEILDSNNNFASSKFTATVAGYYHFNAMVYCASSTNMSNARASIYLNGNQVLTGPTCFGASTDLITGANGMYYMAAGDFMELYIYMSGGSSLTVAGSGGSIYSFFQGFLVRTGA